MTTQKSCTEFSFVVTATHIFCIKGWFDNKIFTSFIYYAILFLQLLQKKEQVYLFSKYSIKLSDQLSMDTGHILQIGVIQVWGKIIWTKLAMRNSLEIFLISRIIARVPKFMRNTTKRMVEHVFSFTPISIKLGSFRRSSK